jgi:hypothetical protein
VFRELYALAREQRADELFDEIIDRASAISTISARGDLQQAARKVLTSYWQEQVDGWDQGRWENCIEEGLIDDRTANAWAEAVWPRGDRKRRR